MRKLVFVALLVLVAGAATAQTHQHPKNTSVMELHYGHGTPPVSPMNDMEDKSFQMEKFEGHWTLMYFWADWCVPCVKEGIPSLIEFANSHQREREKFRIVAIRFNARNEAGDWNDFHRQTAKLEAEVWHSVPPFPLVYDTSMQMTSNWGIHELPTYALVDPHGNLVCGGNLSRLTIELEKIK
jgi:thiol-disulfide isomerase/thioredoxin